MEAAIASCRGAIAPDALIVSVAAGLTTAQIQGFLGADLPRPIIRAMPNTPTAIAEGACGLCGNSQTTGSHVALAQAMFAAVGTVHVVKESQMDAVCGLSGSGPAFVCILIEAVADGGVAAGLPRAVALALATQLFKGTAALIQATGHHPAVLKDAVASPGGTTIAGIASLETAGVRGAMMSAVLAATRRGEELSSRAAPGAVSSPSASSSGTSR